MDDTITGQDPASGLHYRLRLPTDPRAPAFVLLHGLTGDENVMWILETALPEGGLVVSPRGLFPSADQGYSWVGPDDLGRQSLAVLEEAADAVERWLGSLPAAHDVSLARLVFLGFSQGSGLAFALAERGVIQPAALIALAGFLPAGEYRRLAKIPVYWGHGSQDELVPIERAYRDLDRLKELGVPVRFCEADVGHKVGVECLRGLQEWLREVLPPPD